MDLPKSGKPSLWRGVNPKGRVAWYGVMCRVWFGVACSMFVLSLLYC